MGFTVAANFTAIFPERVERLVSIDMIYRPVPAKDWTLSMKKLLIGFDRVTSKRHDAMTYQAAKEKMLQQYDNSIDGDDADVLLVRGLKKTEGDLYEFSWDPRTLVNGLTFPKTRDQIRAMVEKIRCPVLIIKPTEGMIEERLSKDVQKELFQDFRQSSVDFRLVEVEGRHHVHIGHPERVAPHIIHFFNSSKSNL